MQRYKHKKIISFSKTGGQADVTLLGHVLIICGALVASTGQEKNLLRKPIRIAKRAGVNTSE